MGSFTSDRFDFECTRCGACCSPRWAGDIQWMPWHPAEQAAIAHFVGMELDEMREYLGFDKETNGEWMNGFPINAKPCGFRDEDPNEPGKYLCRCYRVQAQNCGRFPNCGVTEGPENLARAAARCPGITVKEPEALALLPARRAEWLQWKARKPYKPPLLRRLRRRLLNAMGVQR